MSITADRPVLLPPAPNDECDHSECSALAMVSVAVGPKGVLTFCGHHYDKLPSKLKHPLNVLDTRKW